MTKFDLKKAFGPVVYKLSINIIAAKCCHECLTFEISPFFFFFRMCIFRCEVN